MKKNGLAKEFIENEVIPWENVEKGIQRKVMAYDEKIMLKGGDAYYIPPDTMHGAVCMDEGVLIDVFSPMREDFIR